MPSRTYLASLSKTIFTVAEVVWKPGAHLSEVLFRHTANGKTETVARKMMLSLNCKLLVAACLLSSLLVVVSKTVKLKARDWDGAPVCAQDQPSRRAMISDKMSSAPGAVGCSMTCSSDHQCRHFNYVATDSAHPCHLYYYRPTQFTVRSNCQHYQMPGKSLKFT